MLDTINKINAMVVTEKTGKSEYVMHIKGEEDNKFYVRKPLFGNGWEVVNSGRIISTNAANLFDAREVAYFRSHHSTLD